MIPVPFQTEVPLLKRELKTLGDLGDLKSKTLIEMGLFETGGLFVFRCPFCGKEETNDQRMELACTGPGWTDDHPIELMEFVGMRTAKPTIVIPS